METLKTCTSSQKKIKKMDLPSHYLSMMVTSGTSKSVGKYLLIYVLANKLAARYVALILQLWSVHTIVCRCVKVPICTFTNHVKLMLIKLCVPNNMDLWLVYLKYTKLSKPL